MISIIMSTYNEPLSLVKKSVESILTQSFKDFEFIIILDNPKNFEVNNYIKLLKNIDSRINVIENEKNIGLAKSLNNALMTAKGNIIARMDADDISYKDRIKLEYEYLCKNEYDLISSDIDIIDSNNKLIKKNKEKMINNHNLLKILKVRDCMAHPTWMGKKELFEALSGYREISCNEDYDFILRAINAGKKIGFLNESLLSYRNNPNGITSSKSFISFLIFNYLRENYKDISKLSETSVNNYLSEINIDKERAKFDHAMYLFSNKSNNYILKNINRLRSFFISRYFRKKIILVLKEKIILRRKM